MLLCSSVSLIRRHWKIILLFDLIPASEGTVFIFVLAEYLINALATAINVAELILELAELEPTCSLSSFYQSQNLSNLPIRRIYLLAHPQVGLVFA